MSPDLELELLRAAQAFRAWREHVAHDRRDGFTCAELLAFVESNSAFARLSHRLVSHVVEALAESLVQLGWFERMNAGVYALTDEGSAELARDPTYLATEQSLSPSAELALRRKDGRD
jgi:hypothetical protein